MSELQRVLSPAQLAKHYELLQFLSRHPNVQYTLAQLDALLPRGVAVQRFPEEWFTLVEDGACWHRSIELHRTHTNGEDDRATPALAAERAEYVLLCTRAEVRTLDELRARVESPSTLMDPEGCVALHTDQMLITPALVRRAVHAGLVYYFPDAYDKAQYRQFGMRDTAAAAAPTASGGGDEGGRGGDGRANAGQVTAALLESFVSREEARGGGDSSSSGDGDGGSRRTYITLPPGVSVQHRLLTRRGVPEQEMHSLPTCFHVGERVLLLFDNSVAVKTLGRPNELRVDWTLAGVRLALGDGGASPTSGDGGASRLEALATAAAQPLRIRRETVAVRGVAAGETAAPAVVSTKVKMELEALQACTLKLILTVQGIENVLDVEVREEAVCLPGVLVRRDRALDGLALPAADLLADPIVNPAPSWHYPYEAVLHGGAVAAAPPSHGAEEAAVAAVETTTTELWSEWVPLPWMQNPSPVVLALREATYPVQDATIRAATRAVFSAQSLADEARLRRTAERMRREADARADSGGKRRRRPAYRQNVILSNRHLLHFGLDLSVPFAAVRK
ncbi:TFIIH basal transcription factor subunit [Novymonas esmeraldas]|uniref:TFIIH basal transcription factor subunit n=1 Tax=Novymonas esmeraldas TaxID=1808958 RepID=A0AAW0FCU1_9TRYP